MSFSLERGLWMKTKEGYGQNPRVPFWSHYTVLGDCWIWKGGKNKKGQGVVRHSGKNWVTSRLAWTLTNGPIPKGMFVCHTCDNPPCINPQHLFLGTPKDNSQDMVKKGRNKTRPKIKIWANCHPNKPYLARGLCSACYQRWHHANNS